MGFFVLLDQLDGWYEAAPIIGMVVILALGVLLHVVDHKSRLRFLLFVPFAALVALLALVGTDTIWAAIPFLPRITAIWLSIPVGFLLFGLLACGALLPRFAPEHNKQPGTGPEILIWAGGIAVVATIVLPLGFAAYDWFESDTSTLPAQHALVSTLDVVVLRDDGATPPPASQSVAGWTVHTYSGRVVRAAGRDRIAWDDGAPPPGDGSGRAARVLLLFPDGGGTQQLAAIRERGEVGDEDPGGVARWLALAAEATTDPIPTYAFLRTTDTGRIAKWHARLARTGDPSAPHGDAVGLDAIGTADTTTDLALRYGVLKPSAGQDLALAVAHRPALFFDDGEKFRTPLNIDAVLASGTLRQCHRGQPITRSCDKILTADDLHNDDGYLAFKAADVAAAGRDSRIYAHVTHTGNDAPDAIYIDYWWYLPDNPTGAVGGALCGAGFTMAGRTCHDHQSDWEGVTVVLDAADPAGTPLAISYAQHDGTSRYTWQAARRQWGQERVDLTGIDTKVRPLAFVARGTHAAYALSCDHSRCTETGARDLHGAGGAFKENGHDGHRPWRDGNADDHCNGTCVELLPTNGDAAARWNAFDGAWGSQSCVLRTICTQSAPPVSPSFQDRYTTPWCYSRSFTLGATGRTARGRGSCPDPRPTASQLASTDTLLALGDSFSSGQGAGEYQHGTDTEDNTCFRSPGAWPRLLADKLHLDPLPSLACSGAVSDEVRFDDPRRREVERRSSQVGRIRGRPQVVTLSIGGNDVGFAKILETCVAIDCVAHYHRPSGDLLEAEVRRVAPKLVATYAAIRDKAPDARLVVLGYPRLFPKGDGTKPIGNCAALDSISGDEADYLNGLLARFDAAIAAAAAQAGATYIDAQEALDGHEERCDGQGWLNHLSVHPARQQASFHPNGDGYRRLADVAAQQLRPLDQGRSRTL
ncbi:MAG TPA: SGNH/GDSL hydrolase family protein [Baekduia sp.]|nr:SGNH/GDSL hydrolase family protein [Baekduia sp.]